MTITGKACDANGKPSCSDGPGARCAMFPQTGAEHRAPVRRRSGSLAGRAAIGWRGGEKRFSLLGLAAHRAAPNASSAASTRCSPMVRAEPSIDSITEPSRPRLGRDIALGLAAVSPLFVCAGLAFTPTLAPALISRTVAVIWASGLLACYAGVRRGLSLAEVAGASNRAVACQVAIFGSAMLSMMFCSPALAAAGLVGVGALDAISSRRAEAPAFFTVFRPLQMALAAAAMLLVQIGAG